MKKKWLKITNALLIGALGVSSYSCAMYGCPMYGSPYPYDGINGEYYVQGVVKAEDSVALAGIKIEIYDEVEQTTNTAYTDENGNYLIRLIHAASNHIFQITATDIDGEENHGAYEAKEHAFILPESTQMINVDFTLTKITPEPETEEPAQ
ncbi:MAG: radical SAM-associated putative lipoprotein [Bacteroidales bacterium]|nr:radical SAM-associated putative lipoprotein [Bacteroidales bacterium]